MCPMCLCVKKANCAFIYFTFLKAVNTGFVSLAISNSTFNRNVIGINLEDSGTGGWWVMTPIITYFVNNKFTCTSPVSSSGDRSDIGLRLKNVPYPFTYNNGNTQNTFSGLKIGISDEGPSSYFDINNYTFSNIDGGIESISNGGSCVVFDGGTQLSVINSTLKILAGGSL